MSRMINGLGTAFVIIGKWRAGVAMCGIAMVVATVIGIARFL